ncbi:glycoside hydrolase domain-containing protein [Streptomyces liangshanensis]|uniref:glycoside hydrolase domain-containing protein n=1 Tax=Streptomyces liangshanensis TaxID=2717324 RepID=UPI0036D9B236
MVDDMVLKAQRFINGVYKGKLGINPLVETGTTSWGLMFALTRALQYELGITSLSDTFGPTTMSTLQSKYPVINGGTSQPEHLTMIIQSALYCKGYDGGMIDGTYNSRVAASIAELKQNMGVNSTFPGSDLVPKVFKGLLNMDAYVTVNGGSDTVRAVQQWLNGSYANRRDFNIIPADGHHSRDVAKSMLFAVQYELGMADGTANGVFGPGTQSGLRSHTVATGSTSRWVQLFSAGMILNQRPVAFSATFNSALASAVSSFQSFVKLPVTGTGNYATWASLLVSYGDQERNGAACDGVTLITPARAATLKAQGITYVGRYLTNPYPMNPGDSLEHKAIQPGELQTIAANGLRCFPIYQTFGRDSSDFSYPLGRAAGQAAVNAALDHGFKAGTRIFFAVDYDALDGDVTGSVLPHFKGIADAIADDGGRFEIGVYGPRNVCTRVGEAGHATASFVSDMSSGFSGNFGYPLPDNWAYDQIVTRTIGSGNAAINIDVNIASGRDIGQASFNAPRTPLPDTNLQSSVLAAMKTDIGKYMESIGFANDGGLRYYSHAECFQAVVLEYDTVSTLLAYRYKMRKALIQTSAYWEMRHVDLVDLGVDTGVANTFRTTGYFEDSSTGICQIFGRTAVLAWNHAIRRGYAEGIIRDVSSAEDKYNIWEDCRNDDQFAMSTVPLIHLWNSDGAPGNSPEENPLRPMSLDYKESETLQILRRYQGPEGSEATQHAKQRLALYQIFEKYNAISRNV